MAEPRVSIVGGAGYAGGELLRLLLAHPHVELAQVSSRRLMRRSIGKAHPNLRKLTPLSFCTPDEVDECDLLFLCLAHGESMRQIDAFRAKSERVIDLSADFRLHDAGAYERWYGDAHARPEMLADFVYGIPELHREQMRSARLVSSAGCNATASILALWPLFNHGLVADAPVTIEVKVGSSEAGAAPNAGSHHPERSGCVRSFAPTGHRHTAEIIQELPGASAPSVQFSATALDMVRGVLCTAHVPLREPLAEKDVWRVYRDAYADEPFIRLIKERDGVYRYPEPKLIAGANFCDIGFERDPHSNRLVVISAIDNLMKGAAGQAVQAMNLMFGFDERAGLEFAGLHP
jgi:N-acetyl-gamma-glutamyl-phosphate/LysW-gamma-L-alpha-aminoadipyl-6-phosphate reductase